MKITFVKKIIGGFIACTFILLCVSVFSFKNRNKFIVSNEIVSQTNQVFHALDQILISTIDAETGVRGFIISGDEDYLKPYINASKIAFEHLHEIKKLSNSNPTLLLIIDNLEKDLIIRFANLNTCIKLRKINFELAKDYVTSGKGKEIEDKIRKTIRNAQQIEYTIVSEKKLSSDNEAGKYNSVNDILLLIISIILLNLYAIIIVNLRALKRAEEKARFLVKDMPIGVILYERDAKISMSNPKANEMLGLYPGQNTGNSIVDPEWKKIHEDGTEFSENESPVSLAFSTNQSVRDVTMGICHPTTKVITWLIVDAEPRLFENGAIRNVVCSLVDITSRKKEKEELRESEQRLKFHLENSPLGVIEFDKKLNVTQWSPEAERIFGWKKEDTIGKNISTLNIIIGNDFPIANNLIERIISGKEDTFISSITNITKSGAPIECTWYNSILLDKEKQLATVMSLVQDITVQKLAENGLNQLNEELEDRIRERTTELTESNEAIRKTEEKYRTVADFATNWEFWIDSKDRMLYCSPSCEKHSGYTATEFVQNSQLIFDIIHPDDKLIFKEHKDNEMIAHICDHEIQYRIIRKDGSIRWMGHFCQPVFDESGCFKGIRGSNKDITARKKTEEWLSTSNMKYKLLSENITDGIFICKNGNFEYVNKAIYDIFGFEGKQLEGIKLTELLMSDKNQELINILYTNEPINRSYTVEVMCLKKDKSVIFVEILLNYVSKDKIIYGVIHDITEKKDLQKHIVKAIIQTEEKERAYFSKELHDGLGPILSTIKLYLQWSVRPNTTDERLEIIGKAETILEEALVTVKEISFKLSPHILTNYGLNSAIKSFVDKVNETATCNIVFDSNMKRRIDVEMEATLYRTVIECINNSLTYAQSCNINIILDDSENQIRLQYKDDGIGFDVRETMAQQKGLGLFNLQNRLHTFGGKVDLHSEPGKGVNYNFTVSV